MSPMLANSYGLKAPTTEQQQYPMPEVTHDDGASAPQVVNKHMYAQTNEKPLEYISYQAAELESSKLPRKRTILGIPE